MVMGFFQFLTYRLDAVVRSGARNTVPSRIARIVPLGLFHIFGELVFLDMRWAFGVMVAHLTPTP
jgi:hypothetical protein